MIHVDEVIGDARDMLEAGAAGSKRRFQVLESLCRLRAEIAGRTGKFILGV